MSSRLYLYDVTSMTHFDMWALHHNHIGSSWFDENISYKQPNSISQYLSDHKDNVLEQLQKTDSLYLGEVMLWASDGDRPFLYQVCDDVSDRGTTVVTDYLIDDWHILYHQSKVLYDDAFSLQSWSVIESWLHTHMGSRILSMLW